MDNELEDKIINDIKNSITVNEAQVIWYLRRNKDNKVVIKLSNALKVLYNGHCDGAVRVYAKYSLTSDEIKILELFNELSEEKYKSVEDYIAKLLKEDK